MDKQGTDAQQVVLASAFLALTPFIEGGRAVECEPGQSIIQSWLGATVDCPRLRLDVALY